MPLPPCFDAVSIESICVLYQTLFFKSKQHVKCLELRIDYLSLFLSTANGMRARILAVVGRIVKRGRSSENQTDNLKESFLKETIFQKQEQSLLRASFLKTLLNGL